MRMIFQLFLFFLLLMGLPDWYIYRNYIRRCSNKWLRRIYWLPTISLLIGMAVIFLLFEPRPHSMSRMSVFLIIFLCINVPKAVFTLLSLLFRFIARKVKHEFYERRKIEMNTMDKISQKDSMDTESSNYQTSMLEVGLVIRKD